MRSSDFTKSHMEKSYYYEIDDFSFVLQSMDYTFSGKNLISNILKWSLIWTKLGSFSEAEAA